MEKEEEEIEERADLSHRRFASLWKRSTGDSNLSLYGFRRFKTSQLLNLRSLEDEVAQLDHLVYQAGLGLRLSPSPLDRLGLSHAKRDTETLGTSRGVTPDLILKLRELLRQYSMCSVSPGYKPPFTNSEIGFKTRHL